MLRSYWRIVFAIIGVLIAASAATAQNSADLARDRQQINSKPNWGAQHKSPDAAKPVTPTGLGKWKHAVQAECGTPKECRAEQREKDDLIAQQVAANAAVSQKISSWWQTVIGGAGVILLFLTVVYTHKTTGAALKSVSALVETERARVIIREENVLFAMNDKTMQFRLILTNEGRTSGVLVESCVQISETGFFADFFPTNVIKHSAQISHSQLEKIAVFEFPMTISDNFIVGYYKYSTIFPDRFITNYFCFEIKDVSSSIASAKKKWRRVIDKKVRKAQADDGGGSETASPPAPIPSLEPDNFARPVVIPVTFRGDLDWPSENG